jgi:hypothetical protein
MKHKLLLAMLLIALISQSVWAAKGGKPEPVPQPNHLMWVDANGVIIGDAQTEATPASVQLYFEVNEKLYRAYMTDGLIYGSIVYDNLGCNGNAYFDRIEVIGGVETLLGSRENVIYSSGSHTSQTVTLLSVWSEDSAGAVRCDAYNSPPTKDVYPAVPLVDMSVYTKPYKLKLIPAN